MATRQFVIFAINNEEFGLDIVQVESIERPLEIFKIPNTPEYLEGLVNLRGKVYTIFNLRTRFEMPKKDIDDTLRIIMVNTGSAIVGLIVDEVREISKVEDKDLENTPKSLSNLERKYISGIAKINERVILLLDLDIILAIQNVV